MTKSDIINAPRFRTLHDAGKYVSAQAYPSARNIPAKAFGAVPFGTPLHEAPVFVRFSDAGYGIHTIVDLDEGTYACTELLVSHDRLNPDRETTMTSAQWLEQEEFDGLVILMPNGWDDIEQFYHYFNYVPITRNEFRNRLFNSILETR